MSDDELKREAEATVFCCSPYDPDCETCRHDAQRILARDYEKLNVATVNGWRVLMFGPRDLDARRLPATVQTIREALGVDA